MVAACSGLLDVAKELLDRGAQIDEENKVIRCLY
jgi:hypothetical protein